MPYRITIELTGLVTRLSGKEWKVVGQKFADEDGEIIPATGRRVIDVYGYTPEIERVVTEEITILEQTVEDLDLSAVIKAVNKL